MLAESLPLWDGEDLCNIQINPLFAAHLHFNFAVVGRTGMHSQAQIPRCSHQG